MGNVKISERKYKMYKTGLVVLTNDELNTINTIKEELKTLLNSDYDKFKLSFYPKTLYFDYSNNTGDGSLSPKNKTKELIRNIDNYLTIVNAEIKKMSFTYLFIEEELNKRIIHILYNYNVKNEYFYNNIMNEVLIELYHKEFHLDEIYKIQLNKDN